MLLRLSQPVLLLGFLLMAASTLAQRAPDLARGVALNLETQGRLMWVDGSANLFRTHKFNGVTTLTDYTTTREGVQDIVQHCKAAHINTLVIDVKPISGQVLYASKIAPRMRVWKGRTLPDFDMLGAFVEEGHKAGLQVHACINVLSEGHKYFSVGPAYDHPDWQSVVYTIDRGLLAADGARLSVRVPGEPDSPNKPTLLSDESMIGSSEPKNALVGLEEAVRTNGVVTGETGTPLGKQLNLILDSRNRVAGVIDSALLGDDPLMAPEDGRLVPATQAVDRTWISQHIKAGASVSFDMKTPRLPIAQAPSEKIACFINPLHPEARRHELDIVREIVSNYDIDGFVLDRCRFSNLYNEFSDRTRDAFLEWLPLKSKTQNPKSKIAWPEDVFSFPQTPGAELVKGPLYKPWLEFRAQTIRDFVGEIAQIVRSVKPKISLGTYVGSWYPKYYEVGVNWGSAKTHLRYPWFTPDYPMTGYAEFFDWISPGCYYALPTREDARKEGQNEKSTVEFAAELSNVAVANGAFVYAGIYAMDYTGKPEVMIRALEAAGKQTQGWMLFDLSYINDYGWWPALEKAFSKDIQAPHRIPDLLPTLRSVMDALQ